MSCEWPIMWQARRRKLAYYVLIGENALWGTSRVAVNKSAKQWERRNKTSFWLPRSSQNFAFLSSCGWRCCVHAACRVCAFKSLCLFSNGCVSVAAFYFCFLVYFFVILFFLFIFLSPVNAMPARWCPATDYHSSFISVSKYVPFSAHANVYPQMI